MPPSTSGPHRALRERLDPLDQRFAGVDVDPRVLVGERHRASCTTQTAYAGRQMPSPVMDVVVPARDHAATLPALLAALPLRVFDRWSSSIARHAIAPRRSRVTPARSCCASRPAATARRASARRRTSRRCRACPTSSCSCPAIAPAAAPAIEAIVEPIIERGVELVLGVGSRAPPRARARRPRA